MEENYILAKWLNNDMNDKELAEFEANPDFEKYQKIRKYTAHLDPGSIDKNKILANVISQKKSEAKVIPFHKKWLFRVAAILVLGFGITFFTQNFVSETQNASNGKKTSFLLPDNSEVVLNSGSQIDYKKWNWNNNRNLNLKGEAYFHVAKGRKFEVNTNLGKVTVLGTQFDVKARENRFDISCFEGRVKVNYNNIQIVLTHGQTVSFENGKQINDHTDAEKPDWLDNKIGFNKENLENILDEIQRQYDVTITLKTLTRTELFSGKLPTDNLNVALEIIATTYHLKIDKTNPKSIIFEEK
jgi:transmembrane sensor